MWDGELRLAQGGGNAEGKDRIDETMRVTETDETFAAKAAHLKRVVRNNVHLRNVLMFSIRRVRSGLTCGK